MFEQPTNSAGEDVSKQEAKWLDFVTVAFEAAKLPEVARNELEAGTYTNAEIAEKLRADPERLMSMLMDVSKMGSPSAKRSILSFAVDMIESEKE